MDTRVVVRDELDFLSTLVALQDAEVLELGCGKGEFARRLAERTGVAFVTALEVDTVQHRRNLEAPRIPRVHFGYGGAEDIPCDDASVDGIVMMKSLHHVPIEHMDRALREVARVLKPDGWAYISEPIFAGPLNDIIRLFHDEEAVRAAAYEALQRAVRDGVLQAAAEHFFGMPVHYKDYDHFVATHVEHTHTYIKYPPDVAAEVRRRLEKHMTPTGASFMRPMRVNLMRRPAA